MTKDLALLVAPISDGSRPPASWTRSTRTSSKAMAAGAAYRVSAYRARRTCCAQETERRALARFRTERSPHFPPRARRRSPRMRHRPCAPSGLAGLRHIGAPAAALAAQRLGALLRTQDSTADEAAGEIVASPRPHRPALPSGADSTATTPDRRRFLSPSSAGTAMVLQVDAADRCAPELDAASTSPTLARRARRSRRPSRVSSCVGQLAFQPPALVQHLRDPRDDLSTGDFESAGELRAAPGPRRRDGARGVAGQRLDAAHAGRDARSRRRSRSGRCRRCAARACRRKARPTMPMAFPRAWLRAHGDDAHLVAVFLAEQRHARRDAIASSSAISRGRDRRVLQTRALAISSTAAISSRVIGLGCEKSKRSRRARPASPSAPRACRAPGAAPRAAGGSPNGCGGCRVRRA